VAPGTSPLEAASRTPGPGGRAAAKWAHFGMQAALVITPILADQDGQITQPTPITARCCSTRRTSGSAADRVERGARYGRLSRHMVSRGAVNFASRGRRLTGNPVTESSLSVRVAAKDPPFWRDWIWVRAQALVLQNPWFCVGRWGRPSARSGGELGRRDHVTFVCVDGFHSAMVCRQRPRSPLPGR